MLLHASDKRVSNPEAREMVDDAEGSKLHCGIIDRYDLDAPDRYAIHARYPESCVILCNIDKASRFEEPFFHIRFEEFGNDGNVTDRGGSDFRISAFPSDKRT